MRIAIFLTLTVSMACFGQSLNICDSSAKVCQAIDISKKERVHQQLEKFVSNKLLSGKVTRVDLEFFKPMQFEVSGPDCKLTIIFPKVVLKERLSVMRKEKCLNSPNKEAIHWVKAKFFSELRVATTMIPKFAEIVSNNTKLEVKELNRLHQDVINLVDCQRVASVTIKSGDVISTENSICKQTVVKGEEITVLFNQGIVSYKLGALALTSGQEGDVINVKFKHNGKVMPAKVIDKGIAKYD